ncbi:MAG: glycoside hydrolase family 5 protein [Oscillospiraceae bacterium]|jgi:aryl-phospho-beta-D-glucosidase BglC (GH1 family)|nr:glycoside hydrolase family 5 protein [Oscillospiraceae bacterium]
MSAGFWTRAALVLLEMVFVFQSLFVPKQNSPNGRALTASDFLHTKGKYIINSAGKAVFLRGTNAGGWLVYEQWMCPADAPDQQTLRNTLKVRFGEAVRDELVALYEDTYWTEQDFDNCAAMGMTAIRLPFNIFNLCGDSEDPETADFTRLDWFVSNCAARGMYVILDLHGAFGSQNGEHHSGIINDGRQLYYNEDNRAKTLQLWEIIALHYKDNPAIAAYDLLNEPDNDTGHTGDVQFDYYDELYKAVRAVDPNHIIIIEACWESQDIPHPSKYGWKNVMYEFHYYAWGKTDDADAIRFHSAEQIWKTGWKFFGCPIYIGEFTMFGKQEAWNYVLDSFNKVGWNWSTWTYKVTWDSSWGIYNHKPPTVNVNSDSADTIRLKWSQVGTDRAWATSYKDIIAAYCAAA